MRGFIRRSVRERPRIEMKNCFSSTIGAKKLVGAQIMSLVVIAAFPLIAGAQSTTTPPLALPYTISTIAGNGTSGSTGNGGPAVNATLSSDVRAVGVDGQGNVYIADTGNNVIREVNAQTGVISVIAGGGTSCSVGIDKAGDNCPAATGTVLTKPRGLAVDKAGNVYIAGYSDNSIHRVDAVTGIMTLVAGALSGTSSTCTHANTCASATRGYAGDNGPATNAELNQPRGVRVDNNGNIWIADTGNNVVRKVDASGIITTVAGYYPGTNTAAPAGFAGDGGKANASTVQLNVPTDIIFDSQNNAYIADYNNHRIREINASTNVLNTIIGNSTLAPPTIAPSWPTAAASASLGNLSKLAIDSYGNLYFADSTLSLVFFYDAAAKTITPIAGEYDYAGTASAAFPVCGASTIGDGCPATQALFYQGTSAIGVALDGQNNVYITDPADYRVRKVSTGLSFPSSSISSNGTETQTIEVHATAYDALNATGIAVGASVGEFTVASTPTCTTNSDNTTNCLVPVAFTPANPGLRSAPLLVTSTFSHNSFPLTGIGQGALTGLDPGTASTLGTGLSASLGEAFDAAGNLYVADTGNNRVVEINVNTQAQTVIAGASSNLNAPQAVAVGASGVIYIADTGNNVVRAIDPVTQTISTVAGGATTFCATALDGVGDFCPATQAALKSPSGLAVDALGNLYIADTGDNLIRRVDSGTGYINLDAGGARAFCSGAIDAFGDGCSPTQAALNSPHGLALDSLGNLYVADTGNSVVRMITPGTDTITAVAGNGQAAFSGDHGAATLAALNTPQALALDAAGDIYIADTGNDAVRMVSSATGIVSTLFGEGGVAGSAGGNGPSSGLQLSSPGGIAIDISGNLYVSDTANSRVIEDNRNSTEIDFGQSNQVGQTSLEQTATIDNLGNQAQTFSQVPSYVETGAGAADFQLDVSASTACAGEQTLTSGENCTLAIAFAPLAADTYAATITWPSNAVNAAAAAIQLSGTAQFLSTTTLNLALTSPASGQIPYGQSGTITATVAPSSGTGTPTGSVTFIVGGTQQPAATLTNGTATLMLTLPPVGGIVISASYSGDSTYAASYSSLTLTVAQAVTTTTLTASSTEQTPQQPMITFTASVASGTGPGPIGKVNFYNGSTLINTNPIALTAGQASVTYSGPTGTGYAVTATYEGNADYSASTSQALSIAIPTDFAVTVAPSSVIVPQGGEVQIPTVTLNPQGGISGTVSLSCTGLPANSTCTFFPTTLSPGGLNPTLSTTLTIYTNVTPLALQSRLDNKKPVGKAPILLGALLIPSMFFVLGGGIGRRRQKWFKALLLIAAVAAFGSVMVITGCTNNLTQQKTGVTPVGTSTVQVIFTGPNGVTHSVPITLTVVAGVNTSS